MADVERKLTVVVAGCVHPGLECYLSIALR
jgi:hypothetical protein